MSTYNSPNTPKEFIQRTNQIIKQYKDQEAYLGENYYDVTLNLNCMLGLVVLPRESKINSLQDKDIPAKIRHTLISVKDKKNKIINIKFKEYIIGLRNGIIHFGKNDSLKFENESGKISAVSIEGKTNNKRVDIPIYNI